MTWPLDPITSDILVLAAVLLAAITLIWKFWDRFAAKRWAQKSEVTAVKRLVKIVEELNLLRSLRDNPTSLLASVAVEFGFGLIGGGGPNAFIFLHNF